MPPIVIDLHSTEDCRDVVHRAVQALTEGQLVVFPTETVYGVGASARSAEGVARLLEAKGRDPEAPLALAIKSAEEALDYVPRLGSMGDRLARRCWPGPITLVVDHLEGAGLVSQLPAAVQRAILGQSSLGQPSRMDLTGLQPSGPTSDEASDCTDPFAQPGSPIGPVRNTLGLRVPAHKIILEVLQMLTGPIALTSANRSGHPAAVTAEAAVESLGEEVALVLDDGRCHYGQPSTVIRVTQNKYFCLREGVVGASALDRLSSMMVLLVCTGNTCRSPMAERMMGRALSRRLGCSEEDLERAVPSLDRSGSSQDRSGSSLNRSGGRPGVMVASAGVAAMLGCAPSREAVEVMQEMGLDLSRHESQPMTDKLVRSADWILTMTASHRQAVLRRWPHAAARTFALCVNEADISDPIGGTLDVYRQCAKQIEHAIQERVANMEIS